MEIKPALTAREWESHIVGDHAHEQKGKVYVYSYCGGLPYAEDVEVDRHGLAALCLHGQPFGFTRSDVHWLRKYVNMEGPSHHAQFMSLADRIEALLPPEEKGG